MVPTRWCRRNPSHAAGEEDRNPVEILEREESIRERKRSREREKET